MILTLAGKLCQVKFLTMRKFFLISFLVIAFYLILSITGIFRFVVIRQTSMLPEFKTGNIAAVSRWAGLKNGKACVVRVNHHRYFSRIAGMEGDTIEINDGYLLRNGFMVDNPDKVLFKYYIRSKKLTDEAVFKNLEIKPFLKNDSIIFYLTYPEYKDIGRMFFLHKIAARKSSYNTHVIVPKGHCFVLSDRRDDVIDSRQFGSVPVQNILPVIF